MQQPRGRAVRRRFLRDELRREIEVEVAYLHHCRAGGAGRAGEAGRQNILASVALCPPASPTRPAFPALYTNAPRSNRPRFASSGFHRSPSFATRAGTFITVKFSTRIPRSTSFHVTGVDTVASGRGRG